MKETLDFFKLLFKLQDILHFYHIHDYSTRLHQLFNTIPDTRNMTLFGVMIESILKLGRLRVYKTVS